MLRLFLVLSVSLLFGLLSGLLCRTEKNRLFAFIGVGGLAGVVAAAMLQMFYPVLFDHFFYCESWIEWAKYAGTGYSLMLLPRSLILLPLGFGGGFALSKLLRPNQALSTGWPVAAFAACFLIVWGLEAEHLPSGTQTRVCVYRFTDNKVSEEQSNEWNKFLDWNWSPFFAYEVYSRENMPRALQLLLNARDLLTNPHEQPNLDDSTFVFVKEYWANGKRVGVISTTKAGFKDAFELGEFYRNFARSRCTP